MPPPTIGEEEDGTPIPLYKPSAIEMRATRFRQKGLIAWTTRAESDKRSKYLEDLLPQHENSPNFFRKLTPSEITDMNDLNKDFKYR